MLYANGDKYVGEFNADERTGHGTMWYAQTGERFVGSWRNGKREGFGQLSSSGDGKRIAEGYWREDRYCGTEEPSE
jgi:hypothetical protein